MIQFQLGVLNLDLTLVMDASPPIIIETSTNADKSLYEAWEWSNRLTLNFMRLTMVANVKSSMPKTNNVREFMKLVKDYSKSDIIGKSIVGNLSSELTNKKFDWSQPIHNHVKKMANLATKLNSMGMEVRESFFVKFILNSLSVEFGQFQVNYNTLMVCLDKVT
uniref:Retrovirus-related Pol polyprotein from transposon TNT 1-94 n=1 Tax=Cajanus cajan TaxID=3821 RepID=A0A151TYW7_CAJCA|nr:hypothetical protein KK1_004762 [Cajanus cajan]